MTVRVTRHIDHVSWTRVEIPGEPARIQRSGSQWLPADDWNDEAQHYADLAEAAVAADHAEGVTILSRDRRGYTVDVTEEIRCRQPS